MKLQKSKRLFTVVALLFLFGLGVPSAGWSEYSILHNFAGPPADGGGPYGSLAQDSTYFYGMTSGGGYAPDYAGGYGVIFKVTKDGTNYTILHSFGDGTVANDGKSPEGGSLVLSGSTLYGMTTAGGINSNGTIFKINTDGSGYTVLHSFGGYSDEGQYPYESCPLGSLTLSGSALYGMTQGGGIGRGGVIFKINTDGSGYAILHSFYDGSVPDDGRLPGMNHLTSFGSTLYGMTSQGGINNSGVIFKINSDGSNYTIIHRFNDGTTPNDGGSPEGGLTISGSSLYGMASNGGSNGQGIVFKVNTDGADYTIVHSFCDGTVTYDGALPWGDITLSGNTLYGMT